MRSPSSAETWSTTTSSRVVAAFAADLVYPIAAVSRLRGDDQRVELGLDGDAGRVGQLADIELAAVFAGEVGQLGFEVALPAVVRADVPLDVSGLRREPVRRVSPTVTSPSSNARSNSFRWPS